MAPKRDDFIEGFRGTGWNKYSPGYQNGQRWKKALTFPVSGNSGGGSGGGVGSGFSSGSGARAGGGFAFVALIVFLVIISQSGEKKTISESASTADNSQAIETPAPQAQDQVAAPPDQNQATVKWDVSQAQPSEVSKPDAGTPAGTDAVSTVDPQSAPVPTPQPSPDISFGPNAPLLFTAQHQKGLGGCWGQLSLTDLGLHFSCSGQEDLDFPLDSIAGVDSNGIMLKSGKKYHFKFDGQSKDQAQSQFDLWFPRAYRFRSATLDAASNPTN